MDKVADGIHGRWFVHTAAPVAHSHRIVAVILRINWEFGRQTMILLRSVHVLQK